MVLFICKKNEIYGGLSYCRRSSGLWNSARYTVEALNHAGVLADLVEVTDNNDIDAVVTKFKPDKVVIEALWVVPEKFDVLMNLHPKVQWFIHMHSNIPFLALEGIAMSWLAGSAYRGVKVIANSKEAFEALKPLIESKLIWLPNCYETRHRPSVEKSPGRVLDVACFGAIRPLKNQLIQALAALKYARSEKKRLRFHINATRCETGGDPILKNLIQLFSINCRDADLVCHPWYEPEDLKKVLRDMDIGMQVSLSETFNVVTADYVSAGLPVAVSDEVSWVSKYSTCNPSDINSIVDCMDTAWRWRILIHWNQYLLNRFADHAADEWVHWALN